MAWRMKWRADCGLSEVDPECQSHEFLCRTLETFMCFDQLNNPNIAGIELLCRQVQLQEERVHEQVLTQQYKIEEKGKSKKEIAASSSAAQGQIESRLYLGMSRSKANLCICPALSEWISEQMKAEAAVAKERRKAREERAGRT